MNLPEDWQPADMDDVRATLGEPEASFGPDPTRLVGGVLASAVSALFGIGLLFADRLFDDVHDWLRFGFGSLFLLIGLTAFAWICTFVNFQILVYESGLVIRERGHVDVVPWKSIRLICQSNDAGQRVDLTPRNGHSFSFNLDTIKQTKRLTLLLAQQAQKYDITWRIIDVHDASTSHDRRVHATPLPTIQASINLPRLGEQVGRILQSAEQIARGFRHDYLGTEHVLLALLDEAPNEATTALGRCGVSLDRIWHFLEKSIESGSHAPTDGERLPHTPRLIAAFQVAEKEVDRTNGPTAILLGLIGTGEGLAATALATAGATGSAIRSAGSSTLLAREFT